MSFDNLISDEEALRATEELKAKRAKKIEDSKDVFVSSGLSLMDKYIEPPFSILDARTGRWQTRKRKWMELGIKSEMGRDVTTYAKEGRKDFMGKAMAETGDKVSIFDPALCELMYKWFCDDGGKIIDPFAGGSVRGIVAHKLGYKYTGIELRNEQVESNVTQAKEILEQDNQPTWICGDSDAVLDTFPMDIHNEYDMIFSCPPYFDLEVYSDDENDLSNMSYKDFLAKYTSIIHKSLDRLKNGGFAVFVVGDVRDERGYYRDFVGDTRRAFMDRYFRNDGAKLYNDFTLLDPIGTAMIRASKFSENKKAIKVHQNVLCFKKQ